jgi:hypothetical protein
VIKMKARGLMRGHLSGWFLPSESLCKWKVRSLLEG